MKTIVRITIALALFSFSAISHSEILKCRFSFGDDLNGVLALSIPDIQQSRVLLAARTDGTTLGRATLLVAIGDVEYAPLKEQAAQRYDFFVANRSPLIGTFVTTDRTVTVRIDRADRLSSLRLYDSWFSKDSLAHGECE